MQNLNLRLLGGLAVGTIVLGAGSYGLHAFQMQRHAGAYLREARRAQEADRPEEAVRHFRRYVKLAPQDTEGLALYGLQLAELEQLQPAYLILDQALRREPGRDDWRRRLVETAIDLERYGDARANLEDHLLKAHPNDPALLAQLGRCHVALGKNDEAAKNFEASVAAAPQRLEGYILLAGLHDTRLKNTAEADRWIDRMVEANPSDPQAYLARGQWRLDRRDRLPASTAENKAAAAEKAAAALAAAQDDARKALELAPKDAEALLFAARVTAVAGQHDEARALAQRGLELQSDSAVPYVLLAEIETAARDEAAAIDWLRRGTTAAPQDADLRWNLARLLAEAGRGDEAQAEIKRLRDVGYPAARLTYLEARIAIAAEQWLDGIHALERARPELAPWPELTRQADFWLGQCYEQLDNPDQQLVALRRAVAADPSHIPSRLGLANALLATGRFQEAQEHYRHVASQPSAPAIAALRLTQLLVVANLRQEPSQRDWDGVTRQIDALESALPGSSDVTLLRAEVLVAQERIAEAATLLDDACKNAPERIELLAARILLAEQTDDHTTIDRLLAAAESEIDDPVAYRVLKGRTLVRRDAAKASTALRELWKTSESLSGDERARLAASLSQFALVAGDLDFAAELGMLAAAASPYDLQLRQLLFDVAVQGRQMPLLDNVLQDVRRIEGEGPLWHYGQALRLLLTADPKAAPPAGVLDALAKARAQRPGWAQPVLLTAELYDRQGDGSRAADAYLEAISLGERQSDAIARAVTLLFEQKRFVEADQVVRKMQDQQGVFTGDLTRLAAETSLRLEEFDRASDLTKSFAVDSDRMQDHTWAGQMLELLGRYDEAESRLQRAIEIDPRAAEPRIALVRVLVRAGRTADAEAAITATEQAVAAEQADVAVAQCYEILGRIDVAEERYRKALAQSPDDVDVVRRVVEFFLANGRTADAEPHLRRFVEGDLTVTDDDRLWARRSLAIIIGTRGGARTLDEALALLATNRGDGRATPADLRAEAVIHASRLSNDSRLRAIALLEQLLTDERTASIEDRYLLAELLRRGGNYSRAAAELRTVLAARPDEARYVSAYIQVLLDRNETSEASLWIDKLKAIAPGTLATADLEARVLFAAGRTSDAVAVLTAVADDTEENGSKTSATAPTTPQDRRVWAAERLTDFCVRLHDSNRAAEAETLAKHADTLLADYLREHPADALRTATLHARLRRIDTSLTTLAAAPSSATPDAIAAVAVAIMTSPAATEAQLARLQQVVDAALERHDRAVSLLVASADLLGWRGELDAAEARYRELLARDANDVRVLNNLALVLALGAKRYDEGLTLIGRAIDIAGPQAALLDTRGLVQLVAGRAKEAQADFERAIEHGSGADRYLHLAAAQWQSRDKEQAQQTLKKAEELGLAWSALHPLERPLLAGLRSELR